MIKIKSFALGLVIGAVAVSSVALADKSLSIFINGNAIDSSAAYIEDGRTYIPLRAVAEALGADVLWNEADYSIDISSKSIAKQRLEDNEILKNPQEHGEEIENILAALASSWNDNIVSSSIYDELSDSEREAVEQVLSYKYEFNQIPKILNDAFSKIWTEEKQSSSLYGSLTAVFDISETDGVYSLSVKQ